MKKIATKISLVTASVIALSSSVIAGGDIIPEIPKAPVSDWSSKYKFFGFSQIGMSFSDLDGTNTNVAPYKFESDRIRLGWKYFSGNIAAKVFLDFAKEGNSGSGMPNIIKDAFIAYKFSDDMIVKAGMIKTPVGMGFTIPGWNLDVIKRGFDKGLAFERATGLMISGRDIGFGNNGKVNGLEMGHERPWKGFGYDLMITGQTGRSKAVINAKPGDDIGYMARLMFDWTQSLHIEASYGVSQSAGGIKGFTNTITANTADYEVLNVGIDSHFNGYNFKFEYYDVKNIKGVSGWDMTTFATTGTYYLTDTLELAVKDIRGTSTKSGVSVDASNTYIGLNYYLNPKNNKMDRKNRRGRNRHRVQINYVLAGGDTTNFDSVGTLYKKDAILLQYQYKF